MPKVESTVPRYPETWPTRTGVGPPASPETPSRHPRRARSEWFLHEIRRLAGRISQASWQPWTNWLPPGLRCRAFLRRCWPGDMQAQHRLHLVQGGVALQPIAQARRGQAQVAAQFAPENFAVLQEFQGGPELTDQEPGKIPRAGLRNYRRRNPACEAVADQRVRRQLPVRKPNRGGSSDQRTRPRPGDYPEETGSVFDRHPTLLRSSACSKLTRRRSNAL